MNENTTSRIKNWKIPSTLYNSAVILEKYGENFFFKGFSTDNGRYRSQLKN